jgi:cytochrome b561
LKSTSYSAVRVLLHWFSAIIIVWALVSGFAMAWFDFTPAVKAWVSYFNVSLTALLIPFFFLRLLLALKPAAAASAMPLERLAAIAHWVLYAVTSLVLVTGVLMMDRPINIFGWLVLPAPLESAGLIAQFFQVHLWSCGVLAVLVALHLAAVIKHHCHGRQVLRRMWF